jgi:CheY-like chemotaxis protein
VPCPQDLKADEKQSRSRLVDEYIRQRQDEKVERPKIDKAKPKILVAEDNTANQTIIKVLLRRKGFDVCVVPDGLEAVAKAISNDFDLVLMDMRMPKMNGMEAIKQIRKEGINIPIIALTALEHNELNNDHTTDLIDGYIPKPIDEHKIDSELSRFIVMPQKVEF